MTMGQDWIPVQPWTAPRRQPWSKRKKFTMLGILAAVTTLIAFGEIVGPPRSSPAGLRTDAEFFCQQFVPGYLKAPSTAKFPPIGSAIVTDNGTGTYTVHGFVDSQNSFGAQLRSGYTCTATLASGNWNLDSVTFP